MSSEMTKAERLEKAEELIQEANALIQDLEEMIQEVNQETNTPVETLIAKQKWRREVVDRRTQYFEQEMKKLGLFKPMPVH